MNNQLVRLFLAILMFMSVCMYVVATYQSKPVKKWDYSAYPNSENNVIIWAQLLSPDDKIAFFGDRGTWLDDKDIQVIQLSIYNGTSIDYVLFSKNIDLSMIPHREVENLMKTNSVGKLAGVIGSSLLSWSFGTTAMLVIGDLGVASALCAAAFLAPSVVCATVAVVFFGKSIKSIIMNKRVRRDLSEKILQKKEIIKSGEQYQGLMFVKSIDYKPQFNVQLREKKSRKNSISRGVDVSKIINNILECINEPD